MLEDLERTHTVEGSVVKRQLVSEYGSVASFERPLPWTVVTVELAEWTDDRVRVR